MSKSKSLINNIQKQKSRKKAGYKSELRPNRLILPSWLNLLSKGVSWPCTNESNKRRHQ